MSESKYYVAHLPDFSKANAAFSAQYDNWKREDQDFTDFDLAKAHCDSINASAGRVKCIVLSLKEEDCGELQIADRDYELH